MGGRNRTDRCTGKRTVGGAEDRIEGQFEDHERTSAVRTDVAAVPAHLGFQVLRLQGEYPDGEALREAGGNRLQRVKIEFEFESRNFMRHGHDATRSDLIVCWEDNWPDSPLEVIELKKIFSGLGNRT
jgi:hypothetical protein